MSFDRDIYGDYIYSPLTVTHAQRAFRNLSCWLGVICLTLAIEYAIRVVDSKPEDFRRINRVHLGGSPCPQKVKLDGNIPLKPVKKLVRLSNGITVCRSCHCFIHKPRTGTGKPPKPQLV